MKANVKVNLIIHLEDHDSPSLDTFIGDEAISLENARRRALSFPLALHVGGTTTVKGHEDAKFVLETLRTAIGRVFTQLSVDTLPPPAKAAPENGLHS